MNSLVSESTAMWNFFYSHFPIHMKLYFIRFEKVPETAEFFPFPTASVRSIWKFQATEGVDNFSAVKVEKLWED